MEDKMKKKNQKVLSVVSAALLATQAFAPAFGISAADTVNAVKKVETAPALDGIKDEAYNGSYTVKFSDLARAGRLDMGTFQMQEQLFYRVYESSEGDWSGLLTMFDKDGKEITWDIYQDTYDASYSDMVTANTYKIDKLDDEDKPISKCGLKFRWTEEGLKSKYFTDATISFLWNDEGIYIFADVNDKDILNYGMDGSNFNDLFSSGWSGRPWVVDCLSATFRIDGIPHTAYKVMNNKKVKTGEIKVDEEKSTSYTEFGVTSLADGSAYYSEPSGSVFNPDTLLVDYEKYTLLNDFCINWWEYCYYQNEVSTAKIAAPLRDKVCKGGDNVDDDGNVGKTCHESDSDFIFRHIMTPDRIAERDAGRAENLKYVKSVVREDGYSLEMVVPITKEALDYIIRDNYNLGLRLQIINAMFTPSLKGGGSWTNGNATTWTMAAMDGGDKNLGIEADNIVLTLTGDKDVFNPTDDYTVGDLNGDKNINSKDLTRLMKYLAGEDIKMNGGDLNGDGKINSKDLTRLMKKLAGEDVVLEELGKEPAESSTEEA